MVVRNNVSIYNTDCIDFMQSVDTNSIELMIADIPYAEVNRDSNGLRNLNKGGLMRRRLT